MGEGVGRAVRRSIQRQTEIGLSEWLAQKTMLICGMTDTMLERASAEQICGATRRRHVAKIQQMLDQERRRRSARADGGNVAPRDCGSRAA